MSIDAGQIGALIGAGILLVGVAYFINEAVREWLVIYSLKRRGISVIGSVDTLRVDVTGRAARHFVTFTFKSGDRTKRVYVDQQVNYKHYRRFKRDQNVHICYLRDKPSIARLTAEDADNSIPRTILIVSIIAILCFPPLILVLTLSLPYHLRSQRGYR